MQRSTSLDNDIIELQRNDRKKVRKMGHKMALTFHDELNMKYAWQKDEERIYALNWMFGSFLPKVCGMKGRMFTTTACEGGALWQKPRTKISTSVALRAGMLKAPFYLGMRSLYRWSKLGNCVEQARKKMVPKQHWYLIAVGIEPGCQGQGLGRALATPVLNHAAKKNIPCYLETFRKTTTKFYKQLGFEIISTASVPDGPPFWCMIRKPTLK